MLIISLLSCTKDDAEANFDLQPHVRFNFLVNSNNEPLEFPSVNGGLVPKNTYTNKSVKQLKIPVTLSALKLQNPVTVTYSVTTNGNSNIYSVDKSNIEFEIDYK